jgi:hypothetical protein
MGVIDSGPRPTLDALAAAAGSWEAIKWKAPYLGRTGALLAHRMDHSNAVLK